jgi:protein-S-isoprenylcysteine O-methyltransferase Ste14
LAQELWTISWWTGAGGEIVFQEEDMVDRHRARVAQQRVAEIEAFYIHLLAFSVVVGLLAALNAYMGGEWWVQWVVLGWGIGVAAHGLALFASRPKFVVAWERRKFRELMRR